jgi:hypothetical protein
MNYDKYNFNECLFITKWVTIWAQHFAATKDAEEFGKDEMYKIGSLVANISGVTDELHFTVELLVNQTEENLSSMNSSFNLSEFHQYQYDNYILRATSLMDICSKIGNLICLLGVEHDKCNWHNFTNHQKVKGTAMEAKLVAVKNHIGLLRTQRHVKLHRGNTAENIFGGIVYWSTIFEIIGEPQEGTTALIEMEQKKLEEIGNQMHKFIYKLCELICHFLTELEPFLEGAKKAYPPKTN